MRVIFYTLIVFLSACATKQPGVAESDPAYHCPGFTNGSWTVSDIPESQQVMLINKQKFAIPSSYQTLWFRSKSNGVGLCIIPDLPNRGSRVGCGTAYAIFVEGNNGWRLKDQKATICSA